MKKLLAGLLAFVIAVSGIQPVTLMAAEKESLNDCMAVNTFGDVPVMDDLEKLIPDGDVEVKDGFKTLEEIQQSNSKARDASARASTVASGKCGANAQWVLDSDAILWISGSGAMYDYNSMEEQPWYKYANQIKAIGIYDGITRIGSFAFTGFMNAEAFVFQSGSVKEIGAYAFMATFPYMKDKIILGKSIELIEPGAFGLNLNMQGFEVDSANPNYCSVNGNLLSKDKTILWQAGKLSDTQITLPDTVKVILHGAMAGGQYKTFENANIELIYANAFNSCQKLTTLKLDAVTGIDEYAFKECKSLTSVTFPKTFTEIYTEAFAECTSLDTIVFKGNAPTFVGSNHFDNVIATASYYLVRSGWTSNVMKDYGGDITWKGLKSSNSITASNVSKTVSTKAREVELGAKAKGGAKLSYKSDNKNITVNSKGVVTVKKSYIGKATITITAAATSKYKKTTKKITVTIKPSKATISSLKYTKSKILLKNKKNAGGVNYQIQYATNSKFENGTSKTTKYNADGYYIISKPKKGKTYYFRVRGYKKVDGTTYKGSWSDVKKIKIK